LDPALISPVMYLPGRSAQAEADLQTAVMASPEQPNSKDLLIDTAVDGVGLKATEQAIPEAATEAAEPTAVAERRAVVNHAQAADATAAAATDWSRAGSGSAEHHVGFGLTGGRPGCPNRCEWEREPDSPKADGVEGWAA
jgi:hypothetical protein